MEELLTSKEAAKELNTTENVLNRYKRNGLLSHTTLSSGAVVYDKKSVATLKIAAASLGRVNIDLRTGTEISSAIVALERRLNRVENWLQQLSTITGVIAIEKEPLTDKELLAVYATIKHTELKKWEPSEVEGWLNILSQITETDLDKLIAMSGDETPWETLLDLINSIELSCDKSNMLLYAIKIRLIKAASIYINAEFPPALAEQFLSSLTQTQLQGLFPVELALLEQIKKRRRIK